MFKRLPALVFATFLLCSGTLFAQAVNSSWQIEVGADFVSKDKSAGSASYTSIFNTTNQFNSEPQELDSSSTGYRFGLRKNFNLQKGYFTSSGASIALNSYDHSITFRDLTTARIERESDVRNLIIDQRFGYAFDFGKGSWTHFVIRPYIGVALNFQQTETTTRVADGNIFNEEPSSTLTSSFFTPTVGLDLFITQNIGLQASFTQSQINTPSASLIQGPTTIEKGFDIVNIFSVSALYNF